jgi:hypothetical protein
MQVVSWFESFRIRGNCCSGIQCIADRVPIDMDIHARYYHIRTYGSMAVVVGIEIATKM